MIKETLLLLFLAFNAIALEPFKAEYTVFKDGKKIGTSSIELSYLAPFYTITDKTSGTHGMASFLGFKRSEVSMFTENEGDYSPESYQMNQKVAFNKRQSEYQIDQDKHQAIGNHKGKKWQLPVPENYSTPNLVSLNLARDICAGKTNNLKYQVLKDGKIKDYSFTIVSQKDGIIEVDKHHSKPERVTKTWLDTRQNCIPVKTYHVEEDEDPLESKLIKVTKL